jgi:hypothetical protein
VDRTLTCDDLVNQAKRLRLPKGWSFATSGTPKDLIYPAAGQAIVVQDELANTWQKLPEGQ